MKRLGGLQKKVFFLCNFNICKIQCRNYANESELKTHCCSLKAGFCYRKKNVVMLTESVFTW